MEIIQWDLWIVSKSAMEPMNSRKNKLNSKKKHCLFKPIPNAHLVVCLRVIEENQNPSSNQKAIVITIIYLKEKKKR